MSTEIDPKAKDPKISADDLTKTTKKGDAELTEEELKRVSGGLKYELTDIKISSNSLSGHGGDT